MNTRMAEKSSVARERILLKQPDPVSAFPRQMHTLPLSWLSLSVGKRLLIVALSYGLGVAGLWFLFPSSPVCLSVQDAGPGIPAEELPLLFEKFVRLKRDLAGSTRGTGLGLYICKQLVEAMGGRIWVESSGHLGEGSRFCVTLPPFSHP